MTSPSENQTDYDTVEERIRQLNEQILESARGTGLSTLDVYEKTLESIAHMQQAAGQAWSVQWFSASAAAQAPHPRDDRGIRVGRPRPVEVAMPGRRRPQRAASRQRSGSTVGCKGVALVTSRGAASARRSALRWHGRKESLGTPSPSDDR